MDHRARSAHLPHASGAGADGAFIKRPDKTSANLFEKDTDWLAGDTVKILEPKGSS